MLNSYNRLTKIFKEQSIELEFSEETFLFEPTGNNIATAALGAANNKKTANFEENNRLALEILGESELSYTDFWQNFCEITGKAEASGKRFIAECIKSNFVEKTETNQYQLKKPEG